MKPCPKNLNGNLYFYYKHIKMKYFTIIPLPILSFCNGFCQTRKLTPAQEDSIVRVIDQWLIKLQKTPPSYWPTNEFLTKHRKTMLLGDQLIFCSADENS